MTAVPKKSVRIRPTARERAILQKEVGSQCPICGNGDVGEFQVHHLNGNPSDSDLTNLLLICPNCHAKFTNHTYSPEIGYQAKLKAIQKTSSGKNNHESSPHIVQINHGDKVVQAAGNVSIRMPCGRKSKAAVPISGVIGTSPHERAYIQYLYNRLMDYKMAIPGYDGGRAGRVVSRYVRDAFGTTKWTMVPIDQFDALSALLQEKIETTPIGRKHAKNGTKAYSTFEEFKTRNSGQKP